MDERRLRAWRALELGPVWRSRAADAAGAAEAAAQPDDGPADAPVQLPAAQAGAASEVPAQREIGPGPGHPARQAPRRLAEGAVRSLEQGLPEPAAGRVPQPAIEPRLEPAVECPVADRAVDRTVDRAVDQAVDRAVEPPARPAAETPVAAMDWTALRAAVAGCRACRLCETRTNTVFGVGPEDARWLVVGEGPGAEEDASGEPFVGPAGRLLDAMLASLGLDRRRNVFIANVVKCRPPKNRNPQPDESQACMPYLRRQIELVAPDMILLLGRVAANALLENDLSVTRMRGRVQELRIGGRRIPAVVTWHPSYLLRRPEEKALSWADLCMAQARFEAERAAAAGGD